MGIKSHEAITGAQQKLFNELAKSGKANTLQEHTRIAVQALVDAGASREAAREVTAYALKDLKLSGVTKPTCIPWNGNPK